VATGLGLAARLDAATVGVGIGLFQTDGAHEIAEWGAWGLLLLLFHAQIADVRECGSLFIERDHLSQSRKRRPQ
jgi:putative Mn2+ efflux pump MntP